MAELKAAVLEKPARNAAVAPRRTAVEQGTAADWDKIKREALRLIGADRLDEPAAHLAYVRSRLRG
jgi:hypothetical protein